MDVVKEEDKQVVDMNETKENQGVSDDLWKPSIGEKLSVCKEDGAVWTVGILEEENKVIAKPPFGKEEEIVRGEDGEWKGDIGEGEEKETKTFVMKRLQAPEEEPDWKPSVIGESVVVWGRNLFHIERDYVCGVGVLEDLQRVVIGVDDDRFEFLMNESGEWTSDGETYKMTKPKTMDHLLTGLPQKLLPGMMIKSSKIWS